MNTFLNYNMPSTVQQRTARVDAVRSVIASKVQARENSIVQEADGQRRKSMDNSELKGSRSYSLIPDTGNSVLKMHTLNLEIKFGDNSITLSVPPHAVQIIAKNSQQKAIGLLLDHSI